MVCSQGGKGDCSRSGAGYRISCLECPNVKIEAAYTGETARNPYSRGLEHLKDLENKSEKSPLWKHCTIQHEGRTVNFKMEALRSFKYPMVRQVNEGARVRLSKADICMNSKSEFHQPGIVRVIPVRGNVNEEQAGISLQAGRGGARGGARGRGRAGQGGRARRGVRKRLEASDSKEDLPDFIFTFCKFIVLIVTTMCAHSHLTQPWDNRRN